MGCPSATGFVLTPAPLERVCLVSTRPLQAIAGHSFDMGNTVSRSHIRDADRGVAKTTRANTKRNSTGFAHDPTLPFNSNQALVVKPDSFAAASASVTSLLPLTPLTAHGIPSRSSRAAPFERKASAEETLTKEKDEPRPSPQPVQRSSEDGIQQRPVRHRLNSAPRAGEPRSSFPENRHSFTYGSLRSDDEFVTLDGLPDGTAAPRSRQMRLSVSARASTQPPHSTSPGRHVPRDTPAPRRRERHPHGNLSFSRNSSAQSALGKREAPDSPLRRPDGDARVENVENAAVQGPETKGEDKTSFLSQHPAADMDPTIPGSTVRDCQTARTQTPPRVDKPPRARKVVSFNENVHVVTYPNEGSSTHSSANGEVWSSAGHIDGKQLKRRSRSMFRLLARVTGPSGHIQQPGYTEIATLPANCFSTPYDTCCGMRRNGVTEVVYDELSPNGAERRPPLDREHGDGRLLSFDSSKDLYEENNIVVSFERSHLGRDSSGGSVGVVSKQKIETRNDTVTDDFDYDERRVSEGEETLSLSDAHPSRDAIDEPEAIGDQLLSPGKDGRRDSRVSSSFNITPLWQRLRRVDELDAVSPLGTSLMHRAVGVGGSDSTEERYLDELSRLSQTSIEDKGDSTHKNARETCSDLVGFSERGGSCRSMPSRDHEPSDSVGKGVSVDIGDEPETGLHSLGGGASPGVASVMYASPPALDSGPVSDPFSAADSASATVAKQGPRSRSSAGAGILSFSRGHAKPPTSEEELPRKRLEPSNFVENDVVSAIGPERTPTPDGTPSLQGALLDKGTEAMEKVDFRAKGVLQTFGWSHGKGGGHDFMDVYAADREGEEDYTPDEMQSTFRLSRMSKDRGESVSRVIGLEMDSAYSQAREDFSILPCSPRQISFPLACVYYGDSSSSTEPNSPEQTVRAVSGLADYPEYAMLKGHGNGDSGYGSEPSTPVLGPTNGWSEPFNEIDIGRQLKGESGKRRHPEFGDRRARQPIPEVLLHDWSGSMPVEPAIEMVESAPNSRSSASNLPGPSARLKDKQPDFFERPSVSPGSRVPSTRLDMNTSAKPTNVSAVTEPKTRAPLISSKEKFSTRVTTDGASGKEVKVSEQEEKEVGQHTQVDFRGPGGGSKANARDGDAGLAGKVRCPAFEAQGIRTTVEASGSRRCFTYVPSLYPRDPKLDDFQVTVERKSFSDTGYSRRSKAAEQGASFIERGGGERPVEPVSDYQTFSRDLPPFEMPSKRVGPPSRRRRVSNLEASTSGTVRDDTNPIRGVVGRLVSGVHIAKRFISPN